MPLPEHVTTEELASLLDLSGRRIRQLADEGVLPKSERNQFPLSASMKAFREHREKEIRAEYATEGTDAADYESGRARLTKAKAGIAEIEFDLMRGKVHDGDAVELYMNEMILNFRARVLKIGSACAGIVAGISDPNACKEVIDERANEACLELSKYNPTSVVASTQKTIAEKNEEDGADA